MKQCLDSDTFAKLCKSENFRRNPVVGAKIYLSGENWNKYVWIEQHGSLDGFTGEKAPDTGQKKQSTKIINIFEEETKMKQELEKYIGELSPEMQEKARQCRTMKELNAMLAENDVELSEDALQAVAGGCSVSNQYPDGYIFSGACPDCHADLRYHDNVAGGVRAHCVATGILYYYNGSYWSKART